MNNLTTLINANFAAPLLFHRRIEFFKKKNPQDSENKRSVTSEGETVLDMKEHNYEKTAYLA